MNVLSALFESNGPGGAELLIPLALLITVEVVYLAKMAGHSRRRPQRALLDGRSLIQGAERMGARGRSSQPYLAVRFR